MNKLDVVRALALKGTPAKSEGLGVAPSNIALTKYWGKRDETLNLPVTSSLSISLGNKGTETRISQYDGPQDECVLNGLAVSHNTAFYQRAVEFLDLFRPSQSGRFKLDSISTIPIAAGLASSASGFASIVLALNDFYGWQASPETLSILARLGSGSACRSLWTGFVEWQMGTDKNGMDSHGIPLNIIWPEFRIGLIILNDREKSISSRTAMKATMETSPFYSKWPEVVASDLKIQKQAIYDRDLQTLGVSAEANAIAMHATMQTARPGIFYSSKETYACMEKVWGLRKAGVDVYFTQDAGPNLKLIYTADASDSIRAVFPDIVEIQPFF